MQMKMRKNPKYEECRALRGYESRIYRGLIFTVHSVQNRKIPAAVARAAFQVQDKNQVCIRVRAVHIKTHTHSVPPHTMTSTAAPTRFSRPQLL